MSKSVLVVGAGGVGLVFAGLLARSAAATVSVHARSNYQAIVANNNQISVKRRDIPTESFVYTPHRVFSAADDKLDTKYDGEPFDYVVVAAKSLGTAALSGLDRYIDKNKTVMFLFQNGIEIEKPYLKAYPGVPLASAVVKVSVSLTAPIEVTFFTGFLTIEYGVVADGGAPDAVAQRVREFGEICDHAGIQHMSSPDIIKARWEKLLWNGTFNTLCAVLDMPASGIYESGAEGLARQVMTEIWEVADKILGPGKWLPREHIDTVFQFTKERVPPSFLPSTLQDVRRGTPIEIEAIVGNLIRAADEVNVPVPTVKVIYALLQGVNYRISQKNQL
ncbi:hypothetical protein D0Z00_003706 [Geotrichum galactomycetum]|uniref:Uncharacterized protein n=1 Tax=Geotrichum galactomycetum TaxID=27317 RepID=A0ACB6V0S9_9ASCO|nr:hypothetical protein D0Z00_003706 [Geotrichum candidum]